MVKLKQAVAVAALFALPAVSSAQIVYSDNFDADTSASYNILRTSTDTAATFGYNYAADGIPSAPNSIGNTTLGLKLEANMAAPTGKEAITVTPIGQSFNANPGYTLKFDMWLNANGPWPNGGTGSTEHVTAGVGHDNTTVNNTGTSGSGVWFSVSGEGGNSGTSTTARDFLAHNNNGTFIQGNTTAGVYAAPEPNSQDNFNTYYADEFPGRTPPAGQQAANPTVQNDVATNVGTVGFRWVEVEVKAEGNVTTWTLNDPTVGTGGLLIATVESASNSGNIAIGYNDIFASVSANPEFSFGIIDNLRVEAIPEPASLSLLAIGGLATLRRRRHA